MEVATTVEAVADIEAIGVAGEAVVANPPLIPSQHRQAQVHPDSEDPSIRIFRLAIGRGVPYITAGVDQLIFVQSRLPAPGRIFLLQNRQEIIERLTSSAQIIQD